MTENFSNIKDILNGVQFRSVNSGISKIIENWDSIVGKKFSSKSYPDEIFSRGNKTFLIIMAKSSSIVQELGFFKHNIISKLKESYNIIITDIIIKIDNANDKKNISIKESEVQETFNERPSEKELNAIIISDNIISELKTSIEKQSNLSVEKKERMLEIIINDLKTQEWMKQKGFPVCKVCGRVMTRKIAGDDDICKYCKNVDKI